MVLSVLWPLYLVRRCVEGGVKPLMDEVDDWVEVALPAPLVTVFTAARWAGEGASVVVMTLWVVLAVEAALTA